MEEAEPTYSLAPASESTERVRKHVCLRLIRTARAMTIIYSTDSIQSGCMGTWAFPKSWEKSPRDSTLPCHTTRVCFGDDRWRHLASATSIP